MRVPRPAGMLLTYGAVAGLAAVLIGMGGYGIWSNTSSTRDLTGVERSVVVNDAYKQAIDGLTQAALLAQQFTTAPSAEARQAFDRDVDRILADLDLVAANGTAEDR